MHFASAFCLRIWPWSIFPYAFCLSRSLAGFESAFCVHALCEPPRHRMGHSSLVWRVRFNAPGPYMTLDGATLVHYSAYLGGRYMKLAPSDSNWETRPFEKFDSSVLSLSWLIYVYLLTPLRFGHLLYRYKLCIRLTSHEDLPGCLLINGLNLASLASNIFYSRDSRSSRNSM